MEMKIVGIMSADEARKIAEEARKESAMEEVSKRALPALLAEIAKGIADSAHEGETSFALTVEETGYRTYNDSYYFAGEVGYIETELLNMLAIAGYEAEIIYNFDDTVDIAVAW